MQNQLNLIFSKEAKQEISCSWSDNFGGLFGFFFPSVASYPALP